MSTSILPQAVSTSGKPDKGKYVVDRDAVAAIFDAAARGDWVMVTTVASRIQLGWMVHEIQAVEDRVKYYGQLEKNSALLDNALTNHTSDGVLQAGTSDEVRRYMDIAVQEMKNNNKPVGDDISKIIDKAKKGEKISVSEAKSLQKFFLDAQKFVVPSEFTAEVLANQVKNLKDKLERELLNFREDIKFL